MAQLSGGVPIAGKASFTRPFLKSDFTVRCNLDGKNPAQIFIIFYLLLERLQTIALLSNKMIPIF
jgi:hypothetical protein